MHIPVYHDPGIGTRGQGYNLGDILNMPSLWAGWTPFQSLADLRTVASQLPQSIAGRYYNCRANGLGAVEDDPCMPHRPRLLRAVDECIAENPAIGPMLQTLQDDSVLCVHLRSGDYGPVDDAFLNALARLSKQFTKIVVLSGVHCNGGEQFIAQNIARLRDSLARIRSLVPRAAFDFNHPDIHVCYMARARNLLVHMGGFSVIGSLVFTGKHLYITPVFQPVLLKMSGKTQSWHDMQIPHQLMNASEPVVKPRPTSNSTTLQNIIPSRKINGKPMRMLMMK